jgi:DNA-binding NarL/FixJ family response regulator
MSTFNRRPNEGVFHMTTVLIADALPLSRTALRLFLQNLNMHIVGEASDWSAALAAASATAPDILLLAGDLLPTESGAALAELRALCPKIIIVFMSALSARDQVLHSTTADVFISKHDTPDRVAEHLRTAATLVVSRQAKA